MNRRTLFKNLLAGSVAVVAAKMLPVSTVTAVVAENRFVATHTGYSGVPAFSFTNDPDMGMWRTGADKIGISVGRYDGVRFTERS